MESHECWGHWYRTKNAWAKERSVKVLTFLMALYDYLLKLKAHIGRINITSDTLLMVITCSLPWIAKILTLQPIPIG